MSPRALFLQCVNAGQYPPIMHASALLADAGWRVEVLSSPSADTAELEFPSHANVRHTCLPLRPANALSAAAFARYIAASCGAAMKARPQLVYASDPLSALPALAASTISRATIVYHEHDAPAPGSLRPALASFRKRVANRAALVVVPNADRAALLSEELAVPGRRIRVLWNMPRRSELPPIRRSRSGPLVAYYHGSITPERLPLSVIEAVRRQDGNVLLRIAGYEAPGAAGYLDTLLSASQGCAEYLGMIPTREDLLRSAAEADIGLALMPLKSRDSNMRHMTGASNKAFDYMAAGLALMVSDLEDWHEMFVDRELALACDPADAESVSAALKWCLDHPQEVAAMASRGRARIEADWNYDTAFGGLMRELNSLVANNTPGSLESCVDH